MSKAFCSCFFSFFFGTLVWANPSTIAFSRLIRGFNTHRLKQRQKLDYLEAVEARSRVLANGGTEEDVVLPKGGLQLAEEQRKHEAELISRQVKRLDEQQAKVQAKKLKREKKKEQQRMQKAKLAKEFETNSNAGRSFKGW